MNKKVGISVLCAGVALSLVMGVSACKKDEREYITQKIEKGEITQKITASGIINPISTINIGTQVSGTIAEIFVDYNTPVTEGQLLAQIDPALFEATVAQRKASLDIAKAEVAVVENDIVYYQKHLNRIKKLNTSKYSTDKELETAQRDYDNAVVQKALKQAQVLQAEAALSQAEIDLRYTKIISPVNGIVVSKEVEVGQTVAASFQTPTLFNVAEDLTKMQIEASVVEADIAKVKEGQTVEFSVDSFPDEVFYGIVTQVRNNPITTSNVVTYEVIIEIDNKDLKIKPGMTANVEIITAQKKGVLLVPNKALRFYVTDENGESVRYKDRGLWVLNNNKPERLVINTGVSNDDFTEVVGKNLTQGMEIIVDNKNETTQAREMRMRMPR
ncbi:MAG: efflux RND transporter periplasmic adaptor subunit [Alphaproteobacteria bacterium]|nr:efflux RND transporter periplasmic adaptor subunit [Alphaproteobacteria bacterium]